MEIAFDQSLESIGILKAHATSRNTEQDGNRFNGSDGYGGQRPVSAQNYRQVSSHFLSYPHEYDEDYTSTVSAEGRHDFGKHMLNPKVATPVGPGTDGSYQRFDATWQDFANPPEHPEKSKHLYRLDYVQVGPLQDHRLCVVTEARFSCLFLCWF